MGGGGGSYAPPSTATSTVTPESAAQPTKSPRGAGPTSTPTTAPASSGAGGSSAGTVTMYVAPRQYAGVNLRSGPGTDSRIILTMPYGAKVRVLSAPVRDGEGSDWYRVTYQGRAGYALGSLLSRKDPVPGVGYITSGSGTPEPRHAPAYKGTWTLTAVGDIMLGRTVYRKMAAYGDFRHPFLRTASILRSSDLTVANLEGGISDNIPQPSDPHTFSFISPTKALTGLRYAGIDGVSLANNHSMNFGQPGLMDTMRALDEYHIAYFGAGANMQRAYAPVILKVHGLRVAFLGFDAISAWQWADPNAPGTATAWKQQVAAAIHNARRQADVVIPFFHWGVEYTAVPNSFQVEMAHWAIDNGADLVLGAHPHWVQSVERYHGRLIVYSLGNFVFDQMWSQETRQGVIVTLTFRGTKLVGVRYIPVLDYDYNQPRVATGYDRVAVLRRLGVLR